MTGRLARTLRRSMTARIGLSIALVGLVLVGSYALVIDRLIEAELRDQSELQMLAGLSFLREDLAALDGGLPAVRELLDRDQRRSGLRICLAAPDGRVLAQARDFDVPATPPGGPRFDAASLPPGDDLVVLRRLRAASAPVSSEWTGPDERSFRVLRGAISGLDPRTGLPPTVFVELAMAPTKAGEVRRREWTRLAIALALAVVVGGGLGIVLARHALADARRLGAAAGRIGAHALDERLSLAEVPHELEASARAFNLMLDRLQDAFERLSRFSLEVAHDLRTPIGNLLGEAQVALSRARSAEEYRGVLESAVEEYERMSRMIGNMLFLARADNEQTVLAVQALSLEALLERVASYFELVAEERGVQIRYGADAGPAAAPLRADEALLVRALGNLVSNALRYAPRGSVVRLDGRLHADGSCTIAVANAGEPIPAAHIERIFERFYRISPSREDSASGSGLGLAIVKSIMDLHHGQVEVDSGGDETVFRLRFPGRGAAGDGGG